MTAEYRCLVVPAQPDRSKHQPGPTSCLLNEWAQDGWHPIGAPQLVPTASGGPLDVQQAAAGLGLLFVLRRETSPS